MHLNLRTLNYMLFSLLLVMHLDLRTLNYMLFSLLWVMHLNLRTLNYMLYSLLLVMQDLYHQPLCQPLGVLFLSSLQDTRVKMFPRMGTLSARNRIEPKTALRLCIERVPLF